MVTQLLSNELLFWYAFAGEGTGNRLLVSAIAHGCGRAGTGPADNWSSGGIVSRVDPDAYELGAGGGLPVGPQVQMAGFRYMRDERVVAFLRHHGLLETVPPWRRAG